MKICFRIKYCTVWGEDVRVRVHQKDFKDVIFPLTTGDGMYWTGELSLNGDVVYQYLIYQNGKLNRAEWNMNERHIHDDGKNHTFHVDDFWRNATEMTCLYTSAFSRCIRHNPQESAFYGNAYPRTVLLRVTAPQLSSHDELIICGNQKILGNWNQEKGIRMFRSSFSMEWSVCLDYSQLTFPMEFKFCAYDRDKDQIIDWETGTNHTIEAIRLEDNAMYILSDLYAFFSRPYWKGAGVAVPVFSLKTEKSFGVGDFGDLKKLIDWAALTHQHVVQVLPINDTTISHTWTDSYPYSSISIYAFHPMYMDLQQLNPLKDKKQAASFARLQKKLNALPQIDYEQVSAVKWDYIQLSFEQDGKATLSSDTYRKFFADNAYWLVPYAAFSYLRDQFGTSDYRQWQSYKDYQPEQIQALSAPNSEAYHRISLYYYIQYHLHLQLSAAVTYARNNHVILKGDIPIGVNRFSVETWTEPYYFNLNGQAGAPPDDFSTKGQNWGFPTYNWGNMAKDGYLWWKLRLKHMAQYFDAYRIDHILGFFRIWEIPEDSVQGLLGQFVPSKPLSISEIENYGLPFRRDFFTRPFINDLILDKLFGKYAEEAKKTYLQETAKGTYALLPSFDTQRKVEAAFAGKEDEKNNLLRDGLYTLISNVLFVPDRSRKDRYHPRIAVQYATIYEVLSWKEKQAFNQLYNDYFYRRHNDFWYQEAMKKLPQLIGSTSMLVCGEDLGMIPECVGTVMKELHILSLEVQRMPKHPNEEFGKVNEYPYHSVCTFSSHDTSTLRGWWEEDRVRTSDFYHNELHQQGDVPAVASGEICKTILDQQLSSTSMLCILAIQDWLSIDEEIRYKNVQAERINVPSNPHNYWRYRLHLTLEQLLTCDKLNAQIRELIDKNGRDSE